MNQVNKRSPLKARSVLAALPRCGARSHQTGEPCKLPGTGAGGKCRFHGGKSTGRPPTHGRTTKKARLERDWLRLLLGLCAAQEGVPVKAFKPGRLTAERVAELLAANLRRRRDYPGRQVPGPSGMSAVLALCRRGLR